MIHFTSLFLTMTTVMTVGTATVSSPAEGAKKQGAKDRFAQLDTNADGVLSQDEFVAGHDAAQAEQATKRFKKADTDGDGVLSREEFRAFAKKAGKGKQKSRPGGEGEGQDPDQGQDE